MPRIVDDFLRHIEAERRLSPLTVRNYRRDIDDLLEHLGCTREEFTPTSVTRQDLEEWIEHLYDKRRLKASSVNRSIASIRSLWRWMMSRNIASKDIVSTIHRGKTPRRLPTFVPESRMTEVIDDMREKLQHHDIEHLRDVVIVLLLYTAGLRLAELTALNRSDVADDFSSIRVTGKGRKQRIAPLPHVTQKIVKKYFLQISLQNICISQKKALILSNKGERLSHRTVQRIVERMLKGAGVEGKRSPHLLRHTFATHLLNEGADMREIQELLGHSSLRATQIYTHNDIEKLRLTYLNAHPREQGAQTKGAKVAQIATQGAKVEQIATQGVESESESK